MSKNLQLLLRLQELNLLHQGLTLAAAVGEEAGCDVLEERINRVRRQVPGSIQARYDAVSRQHLEPMAAASDNQCRACLCNLPPRLVDQLAQPNQPQNCPHCGRILYPGERSPDYLGTR